MMKLILSLFLVALIGMTGCDKKSDDKDVDSGDINGSIFTTLKGEKIGSVKLSALAFHKVTFTYDTNQTRTDSFHSHGIVSSVGVDKNSTATYTVEGNNLVYKSSVLNLTLETADGKLAETGKYLVTVNGKPTTYTVTHILSFKAHVDHPTSKKERLMAMGLDAVDAEYLVIHHENDVDTVLAKKDRVFKDLHLSDAMFALPSDPDSAPFADPKMTVWSVNAIKNFKRAYGRIAFLVNSPKFKSAFDQHITLLNSAYQGTGSDDVPYPQNFDMFKQQVNTALNKFGNHYKFFLSANTSGFAYGLYGLKLKVESGLLTLPSRGTNSDLHNAEALIFHEMTHTFGFAHAGNDARTTLIPNNIPYYVQFIVGVSAKDPMVNYPVVTNGTPYGTSDALATIYFGNDIP